MSAKEKLISIRAEYYKNKSWFDPKEEPTDGELLDFLNEGNIVSDENAGGSRWWNNLTRVSEVEGTYFQYSWAETTGDMGIWEVGWEFDWNSLVEVEPYHDTVVITKYRPK